MAIKFYDYADIIVRVKCLPLHVDYYSTIARTTTIASTIAITNSLTYRRPVQV